MELRIARGGRVRCLYDEALDLPALGALDIRRGAHVEPTAEGGWTADLSPVAGPLLGPFISRSAALQAEREWLLSHWLSADLIAPAT